MTKRRELKMTKGKEHHPRYLSEEGNRYKDKGKNASETEELGVKGSKFQFWLCYIPGGGGGGVALCV